ncbi:HAMP domain-containing sensor histidine kinase [Lishizhenia sp.]|uniref:sensor histidine kinase n=1 Tax=Lishizhenia sp. TaxID=2497594 RepID=UPI00299E1861|nr:HAMP domain-containing sensor histidine kinase [Lishizhenia sp.]MDX1447030.1 HAMP domain-containing sensor histidine kinase [Lishizhenia sp.]
MKLYTQLSKTGLLKSYSSKFLAVAFLGIHVPLIGIILFIVFNEGGFTTSTIIILTLILTLGATALTLFVLNKLLAPLKLAKSSLKNYLENQELPNLPLDFNDEIGELLKDLQFSIKTFDHLIESKQNTIEILSHDLRSPCNNINTLLDMYQKKTDPKDRAIIIEHIRTTTNQQLELITNTLINLRDESITQGKLKKERLNLNHIIHDVINAQKAALDNKKIKLRLNAQSELNINGNETAFRQVFNNLIGNAIKFSETNSEIIIASQIFKSQMRIDIIDQGIGFDNSISEALFKPFTEYSRKGTKNEPSEGMGLFISRRFINKHSGTLEATSPGPNQGSTFTIQLPLN